MRGRSSGSVVSAWYADERRGSTDAPVQQAGASPLNRGAGGFGAWLGGPSRLAAVVGAIESATARFWVRYQVTATASALQDYSCPKCQGCGPSGR